jgi:probable selenium-dependent hydroxylase accessory protein YqeC
MNSNGFIGFLEEELQKYAVISIVGSGGKTSLMFMLAKELSKHKRVLITTTTKIYVPKQEEYRRMEVGKIENFIFAHRLENGVYVYGSSINDENKLIGVCEDELNLLKNCFDYIIIESDGSKQKPLKGWREDEPVIYSGTELTVGIIDIQILQQEVNSENIHRLPIFLKLTHAKEGEKIGFKHLIKVITHQEGIFKNSLGRKMLFINKVESFVAEDNANKLVQRIKKDFKIDCVIIGSVKDGNYKVLKSSIIS